MECPYCKKDINDKEIHSEIAKLVNKHGLISENVDPGGRELIFPFGSIHLSDRCSWCDYEKLKVEIKKITNIMTKEMFEFVDALLGMVMQWSMTRDHDRDLYDHMALSSDEDTFDLLIKYGYMEYKEGWYSINYDKYHADQERFSK